MRSHQMRPGDEYVLRSGREIRVTVLETPPEVRARAHVRVRFEDGVKAGEVLDVASRRIVARWDGQHEPIRPARRPRTRVVVIERPPNVGDEVLWTETGPAVWTVEGLDDETGVASIAGVLFDQPTRRSVAIEQLNVRPVEAPEPATLQYELPDAEDEVDPAGYATPGELLGPEPPRRELEVLLDDILFSPLCVEGYRRRYAPQLGRQAAYERLRAEIWRKGYIEDGAPGEYRRIRVVRRFDVILPTQPTADDPFEVSGLYFPANSRPAKRTRPRRGKRKR